MKNAPAPRPNKRPRLDTSERQATSDSTTVASARKQSRKSDARESGPEKAGSSSQLTEFMQVMKPRTKNGRTWANDDVVTTTSALSSTTVNEAGSSPSKKGKDNASAAGVSAVEDVSIEPETGQEPVSDMDWLKQRQKKVLQSDSSTKAFEQSDDEAEAEQTHTDHMVCFGSPRNTKFVVDLGLKDVSEETHVDPVHASILKTSRIFLRNLSFACTEADLMELFRNYGEVAQVSMGFLSFCIRLCLAVLCFSR